MCIRDSYTIELEDVLYCNFAVIYYNRKNQSDSMKCKQMANIKYYCAYNDYYIKLIIIFCSAFWNPWLLLLLFSATTAYQSHVCTIVLYSLDTLYAMMLLSFYTSIVHGWIHLILREKDERIWKEKKWGWIKLCTK